MIHYRWSHYWYLEMYYTPILLCVVGFFQHYLFRYDVYSKTFECDFGEKIKNEYFIYLINFVYFLIEKVSRPSFMSMIITSVFPSPFFHRDLTLVPLGPCTFGFISVSDRVHGQSSPMSTSEMNGNGLRFGHRLGHRHNHESKFMTSNSWSNRGLSENLEHGLWQTRLSVHSSPTSIHGYFLGLCLNLVPDRGEIQWDPHFCMLVEKTMEHYKYRNVWDTASITINFDIELDKLTPYF